MTARWVVRCDEYAVTASTRETAERRLAEIETLGACRASHVIVDPDGEVVA